MTLCSASLQIFLFLLLASLCMFCMMSLLLVKSYDMPPCCLRRPWFFPQTRSFQDKKCPGFAACSTAWMTKPRSQPRPTLTSPCQTKCWITRRQAKLSQQLTMDPRPPGLLPRPQSSAGHVTTLPLFSSCSRAQQQQEGIRSLPCSRV